MKSELPFAEWFQAGYYIEAIRTHLNKDCALGSSKFQDEIEAVLGQRAKIAPQGRPKKLKGGNKKVT
ncbi:MAG: hypothetical protein ACXWAB_10020 [Methylobacter sp.]